LINKILISLIIYLSFGLVSCEKLSDQNDFRNKYIGKYQVVETRKSFGFPYSGKSQVTTKDTVIIVRYGYSDSTLLVLGSEIVLDENDAFFEYYYSIRFFEDSIATYYRSGGLGGGTSQQYNGVRIDKMP